jgi:hypothetical protein
MSTVAEMRIADLKRELTSLEVVEKSKATLLSQLTDAQAAENEAARLVHVNGLQIEEGNKELADLRRSQASTPQFTIPRDKVESQIRFKEESIRALTVEAGKLEKTLGEKRSTRVEAEKQIATHSVYQGVRKPQFALVSEAAAVIESFFETPLSGWPRLAEIVSKLEQRESALIARAVPELSAAGLPDIPRILNGFFQQAVPHTILGAIDHERTRAFQEVSRVREMASRGAVR